MSYKTTNLPNGVELRLGKVYPDRWISPDIELSFTELSEPPIFQISLWNPDFSAQFHMNSLTVSCDGVTESIDEIRMGQIVDIAVDLSEVRKPVLAIKVRHHLASSELDRRARAMTVVSMDWIDAQ